MKLALVNVKSTSYLFQCATLWFSLMASVIITCYYHLTCPYGTKGSQEIDANLRK